MLMQRKRIKILYLITGLKTGGAEMVLYRLLEGINRDKFEPVVVSIIPVAEIGEKIKELGIKVLSLEKNLKYNPFILFRLINILKKEKPQILHSFLFHAIFLGRIAGKICSVPIILSSVRSSYIGGAFRNKLLQLTNRLDDAVTIVSRDAKNKMAKEKAISSDKTIVVYNGLDLKKFPIQNQETKDRKRKELGIEKNRKVLIVAGRLFKAKGYPYLIEAIKNLKSKYSGILLFILGEGEERKKLEFQIKKFNLEKNIFLLGQKSNVIDYLEAGDLFVLSSLWEGLPNAVLEAMACGLPVVATNVGGVPEIIEDNLNGFLVEPKNASDLSSKIDKVFNLEEDKIREIKKKARETIEARFSLKEMARSYENLYDKLLESKGVSDANGK